MTTLATIDPLAAACAVYSGGIAVAGAALAARTLWHETRAARRERRIRRMARRRTRAIIREAQRARRRPLRDRIRRPMAKTV